MKRFLVESTHTPEECEVVVQNVYAAGYLTHFDWGCKDGVHCGWVIIEADDAAQASLVVPVNIRKKARIVPLTKYSAQDLHPA